MATVVTKEHLAIVDALRAKYAKVGDKLIEGADRLTSIRGGGSQGTNSGAHGQPTQEVPGMAVHPSSREGVGRQVEYPPLVESGEAMRDDCSVMENVEGCIVASLKPSSMINVPLSLTKPSSHELTLRAKRRGRWLAVALRVEFDPQCINLTYVEKARLIGLAELCGDDEEEMIYNYTSILNDAEFVTTRKKALEAFEHEMDVPTAVCIAEAAKRDPQYAIMRRRIRQLDKKQATLGDQKDQFGQLYDFLHGRTEYVGEPPGNGGNSNGQVTERSSGDTDEPEGAEGASTDLSESANL